MYLAYIDESGNYDLNDETSLEFVLVAVIIHEKDWVKFQKECKSLKEAIWYLLEPELSSTPPNEFELHMKEICNRENFYECLKNDDEKWFKIIETIFEKISQLDVNIISSIIIKDKIKEEGYEDVKHWSYTLLFERLQRYISHKTTRELDEFILTVLDSEGADADNQKREYIKEFMICGTGHGWEEYLINIIETPFIVDSEIHLGIQIADVIAYVLRRYVYKILKRNPNAFFNEYCDKILGKIGHLFHRSDYNRIDGYGIKIFPHTYNIDPDFWRVFKLKDFKPLDDF